MKSNTDKCNLIISNHEGNTIKLGDEEITGKNHNKLNFNEHVTKIYMEGKPKVPCSKTNYQILRYK